MLIALYFPSILFSHASRLCFFSYTLDCVSRLCLSQRRVTVLGNAVLKSYAEWIVVGAMPGFSCCGNGVLPWHVFRKDALPSMIRVWNIHDNIVMYLGSLLIWSKGLMSGRAVFYHILVPKCSLAYCSQACLKSARTQQKNCAPRLTFAGFPSFCPMTFHLLASYSLIAASNAVLC